MPVLVPPDGWIGDPDSDGIVCGECATTADITKWMADASFIEQEWRAPDD